MKRLAITTVLTLGTLMLGACVNIGAGKPPAQLFTLSAERPAAVGTAAQARPADVLIVAEPESDRVLALPRIAVRLDATSVAYMKDGAWAERPARLLRNVLAEGLRAKAKHMVLLDEDTTGVGVKLGGRLVAMGYDAPTHTAVIRYDALLSDGKGALRSRRFEAVEYHVEPKGAVVAAALNRAANQLAGEVADWVG